jgi:hypoxanthine phosphoribosyltransferase
MRILFNQNQIKQRILALGEEISQTHKNDDIPVVFVCLLTGGFMFFTDLVKTIAGVDIECDFMKVKSYESQFKQGDIKLLKDLDTSVKGKHVYIVDDILDTGNTVKAVVQYLQTKQPVTLNIVTLIKRKGSVNLIEKVQSTRYGFLIDTEWIVGYGCNDERGYFRNLNGVFAL